MFAALFKRAQLTVDNAIVSALNYVIVAVPFLIAFGFLIAYLTIRLTREFGIETALLAVTVIFLVGGFVLALILLRRGHVQQPAVAEAIAEPEASTAPQAEPLDAAVDRELMSAAITSLAPMALPMLLRIIQRNLPLIAAIGAAAFVFTRTPAASEPKPADG